MKKYLSVSYSSSLADLCEVNTSFDRGILRVCYHGENRNETFISKKAIIGAIPSLFNCPLVCRYDRETDTLGGHDVELVRTHEGELRLINSTHPVGLIPESSKTWFEEYEEEDGTLHEYLCVEVLLWKRQEAYQKIKKDGITAHSMEINVKEGKLKDGLYYIDDFEFTAFALIGVTPCFEGSALEVFSEQNFKHQLSEMLNDFKESFKKIVSSQEDDNTHPQQNFTEGGEKEMQEKIDLAAKYGIDTSTLDFSMEDLSIEELTQKFEEMKATQDDASITGGDTSTEPANETSQTPDATINQFALTSNIVNEIQRVLSEVKVEREWGESDRYWFQDCDFDLSEVYCWDVVDWLLYGFTYTKNDDAICIDFDSKKRKKLVIADFEGESVPQTISVFASYDSLMVSHNDMKTKYQEVLDVIEDNNKELESLRAFKADIDHATQENERTNVLAKFTDLDGNEDFEALRKDAMNLDVETLEEKCFAIRGKMACPQNFSLNQNTPKIVVPKADTNVSDNDPYGGIVAKYTNKNI